MSDNRDVSRTTAHSPTHDLDEFMAKVRSYLDTEIEHEEEAFGQDFSVIVDLAHHRNSKVVTNNQVEQYRDDVQSFGDKVEAKCFSDLQSPDLDLVDRWLQSAISSVRQEVMGELDEIVGKEQVPPIRGIHGPRKLNQLYVAMAIAVCVLLGVAFAWDRLIKDRMFRGFRVFDSSEISQAVDLLRFEPDWQPMSSDGGFRAVEGNSNQLFENIDDSETSKIQLYEDSNSLGLADEINELKPKLNNEMTDLVPSKNLQSRGNKSSRLGKTKNRGSLKDKILGLDAKAQELWRLGNRPGAERIFRRIVRIAAGTHPNYADLAYGDLFVLVRQEGREGSLVNLWTAYLRKFPRGRFAEDARAGLCEQKPKSKIKSCWKSYLNDFSRGAHRKQALLELGKP